MGAFLAQKLGDEGHNIVIIEKDLEKCERLSSSTRALVIHGDACDYRFQREARVEKAQVFAAVTGDDDDNLVACQLAKISFGVPRAVARVNNPKNERIFNLMGISAISSTTVIGHLIEEETTVGDIITLHMLKSGRVAIVEVDVPDSGAQSIGKAVKDLDLPDGCVLVSILRGEDVIIPRGNVIINAGDSIIAVASIDKEMELRNVFMT